MLLVTFGIQGRTAVVVVFPCFLRFFVFFLKLKEFLPVFLRFFLGFFVETPFGTSSFVQTFL